MNIFRVAVIGAGHLGKIHARLVKQLPEAHLAAIVDPVTAAREQLAADLQTTAHADHRPLLGAIDAAIIATPTQYHAEVARDLLRNGVHVLIEKPITLDTADADSLIDAAAEHELVLQVGHVERFNPAFIAAESYLAEPKFIETNRCGPYTCRSTDVGVVLDLLIHDIDLVLSLVRDELVDVQALGAAVFGPHEDWARARLTFANGCVAQLSASRVAPQAQRSMHVYTPTGFATLDFNAKKATLMQPSAAVRNGEIDVNSLSPAEKTQLKDNVFNEYLPLTELQIIDSNAILEEQRDFLSSIAAGRSPRVTGRDGRNALAVAEQIVASINSHSWDTGLPLPAGARIDPAATPLRGPHWQRSRIAAPLRRAG